MRTIEQTGQFKRDYKREAKGPHRQTLASDFVAIVTDLANDQPLAEKHRDRDRRLEGSPGLPRQARPGVDLSQTGRRCVATRPPRLA
jgi:mRNA-degrading endonuclease YafQ of YafQ-DinJ toxin-antitoxin module